jgi:hypothetical protein
LEEHKRRDRERVLKGNRKKETWVNTKGEKESDVWKETGSKIIERK